MKIDCTECAMYRSNHCEDCLVTHLLRPPEDAVVIDDELWPPLGALSGAGLIPVLKYCPREELADDRPRVADTA